MIQGVHPVIQAFLGTLLTWGLTAFGSALVFLLDFRDINLNKKILDCMLGFAAGVMLAASYWSLLAPAIDIAKNDPMYGPEGRYAFIPATIGFFLGVIVMVLMETLLEYIGINEIKDNMIKNIQNKKKIDENDTIQIKSNQRYNDIETSKITRRKKVNETVIENMEPFISSSKNKEQTESFHRVILLVIAITIHNFPEGMAVGVGFGSIGKGSFTSFRSAVNLAIGIGLQNFPEGLAVSMPLRREGMSAWNSFLWGQLSGLVEPIGGIVGAAAVYYVEPILPYALSFAAGAMIFVVVDDLIPEACQSGNKKLATIGTMIGFLIMMTMDISLG